MTPLPETRDAVAALAVLDPDDDLLGRLLAVGTRVLELVPSCVAVCVSDPVHGVVLGLVGPALVSLDGATPVLSSVHLPLHGALHEPATDADGPGGGVVLHASEPDAFRARLEEVAAVVGGRVADARHDTDLDLTALDVARRAPEVLRERALVDTATGLLAVRSDVALAVAATRLRVAAAQEGLSDVQVARLLLILLDHEPSSSPSRRRPGR